MGVKRYVLAALKADNKKQEINMRYLHICEKPYNLYRTILKVINSNDENDILLTNNSEGMKEMFEEISKSGIFRNSYYYDEQKHDTFTHVLKTQGTFSIKKVSDIGLTIVSIYKMVKGFITYIKSQYRAKYVKLPKGINLCDYDEIYITDCTSIVNFYLYRKKLNNLVYVEHAKNALSGKYPKITNLLNVLVKMRIIYGIRGSCRYIRAIEVSSDKDLVVETKGKEIRVIPVDNLVNNLSHEQREQIFSIYATAYNLKFYDDVVFDMFLTTTIHGRNNEYSYFQLSKQIIKDYLYDAEMIILKPHPLDKIDYSILLSEYSNIVILPSYFSVEILTFNPKLKIRKLVSIDSTANNSFSDVKENIMVGYEYINKYGI